MKVLFLIPPAEHSLRKGYRKNEGYGLGRAYLMSYLKSHGHEVDTIPFNMCSDQAYLFDVAEKILFEKPDFISITIFSVNRVMSYRCIEWINTLNNRIKIVVGGHHASALPEQLIEKYPYIQVVVGEGERALLDIVEGRETNSIVERPLIEDLDNIPFPDHDFIFDAEPDRNNAIMLTSRGCPFHCSFCCLPSVSHKKFRTRSIQNVYDEIIQLKTKYPRLKSIGIQDDAFMMNNQRVIELCKKLVENNINLSFWVSGRVKPVSEEMLYWMDKAGMHFIAFGLETGNQDMLDRCHKTTKLEDYVKFFEMAKKYPKIQLNTYLMTGLPGETEETVNNTIKFVRKLQRIKYDLVFDSTPTFVYPETELYEMMKSAGKIDESYWLTDKDCPIFTLEHSEEQILKWRKKILVNVSFLRVFTPWGILQFLNAPRNLLQLFWHHPENIKFALGDSFSIMFPKLYRIIRGDKVERRYEG